MRVESEAARRDVTAPKWCPFCGKKDVTTTSRIIDESTYWRCLGCGEIWNPGRLRSQGGFVSRVERR